MAEEVLKAIHIVYTPVEEEKQSSFAYKVSEKSLAKRLAFGRR